MIEKDKEQLCRRVSEEFLRIVKKCAAVWNAYANFICRIYVVRTSPVV